MSSGLYVVHAKSTPYYKIGISDDLDKRIRSLQGVFPFISIESVVLHVVEDRLSLERGLHSKFQSKRFNGEWFALDEDDLSFLRQSTDALVSLFPQRLALVEEEVEEDIKEEPADEMGDEDWELSKPKPKQRLRRVPDDETIDSEDLPSVEAEFYLGLVPEIKELYEELGTWQSVADHYGVPKHIVWNIGVHQRWPIDWMNDIRARLGLSGLHSLEKMPDDVE